MLEKTRGPHVRGGGGGGCRLTATPQLVGPYAKKTLYVNLGSSLLRNAGCLKVAEHRTEGIQGLGGELGCNRLHSLILTLLQKPTRYKCDSNFS